MIRRRRHILFPLVAVLFLSWMAGAGTYAQSNNARLARYEKEIDEIRQRIKALDAGAGDADAKLRFVRAEIETRKDIIASVRHQLDSLTLETRLHEKRIDSLHRRMDTLTTSFNQLVGMAYKTRSARHWYLYVFSGETFAQGVRRARYMRDLSGTLRQQARDLLEVRAAEESEKVRLDSLRSETSRTMQLSMNQLKSLEKSRKEAEGLIAAIQKDKAAYKKRLDKTIAERNALKKEIDAALAAAAKKDSKSSKKASSSSGSKKASTNKGRSGSVEVDASLKGNFAASTNKGKLPWPASGVVIERFGDNIDPVYRTTIRCDGITLSTQPGAEIRVIYEGVVTSAVKSKSRFNYIVIIQHGGNYRTIYCYLDDNIQVKVGDKVKTGQLLGHALVSGGSSQVHFQIRDASNTPVDPKPWLRK